MRKHTPLPVLIRNTRESDFGQIIDLCRRVYADSAPWAQDQLASHLALFPEGQLVAEDPETRRVVGMAASLVIDWDGYDFDGSWQDFTDGGYFTNHDLLRGRTLYGAEIMVDPQTQGRGVGKAIYAARRDLCKRLRLLRIRAGGRIRGYANYADEMDVETYIRKVVDRQIHDPTISFQLKQGFRVIGIVGGYLRGDSESLGYAALIEWLNHDVARRRHYASRNTRYLPSRWRGDLVAQLNGHATETPAVDEPKH